MTLQELLYYKNRPLVMAIMNLTPDSFSGDGLLTKKIDRKKIISLVKKKLQEGADIIDLGAESTRPGATKISGKVEWQRLEETIHIIREEFPTLPLSIDSYKLMVMKKSLSAGVKIINDIAFGHDKKRDDEVIEILSGSKNLLGYVVMHNLSKQNAISKNYLGASYQGAKEGDMIASIEQFFTASLQKIPLAKEQVALDVGFGFGKNMADQLTMIHHFEKLIKKFQQPLLVGVSRKSFIGKLLGIPIETRDSATTAIESILLSKGAKIIRTHDVKAGYDNVRAWQAINDQTRPDYFIGMGSNVGDRHQHLLQAITALKKIGSVKSASPIYETKAMYHQQQRDFLNAVISFSTPQEPEELLSSLKTIEKNMGRNLHDKRNHPRPIDLDIIAHGEQELTFPQLTIPHPLAHERAFVLQPLCDLMPLFLFRKKSAFAQDLLPALLAKQNIVRHNASLL